MSIKTPPGMPLRPDLKIKDDLIDSIRDAMEEAGVRGGTRDYASRIEAELVLDMFIRDIRQWLSMGDHVRIDKLGTLRVHPGKARLVTQEFGRPITPHKVMAPRRHVTFRDSAELRRSMREWDASLREQDE